MGRFPSQGWLRAVIALSVAGGAARGSDELPIPGRMVAVTFPDHPCDAMPRPTDPGRLLPFDPQAHRLIELLEISLSLWAPDDPSSDLFTGAHLVLGGFARLDLLVDGLVNPPGSTEPLTFDPFAFGPHPVFGFIELDMDTDPQTGGEVNAPQYRYLGNVARFGGHPAGVEFVERVARDESAFDGDFITPPQVERHGEEFHLALLGGLFDFQDILEIAGDADTHFESGEIWNITAPLFHRAHGYEPFSLAQGGAYAGEYAPEVTVRFMHDPDNDHTRIILVFPLTNAAAALMRGEAVQPDNADPSDQASVLEAFEDLVDSAQFVIEFPTGRPDETLILPWALKTPTNHLDPSIWRPTAILGSSYTIPDSGAERFVWTDMFPDALRGDVNGNGAAGTQDRTLIQQYIATHDAADGQIDGRAEIEDFAADFSIFDVYANGVVDATDVLSVSRPGDLDNDQDVDLRDFAAIQACILTNVQGPNWSDCILGDLDADGDVDAVDAKRFILALSE